MGIRRLARDQLHGFVEAIVQLLRIVVVELAQGCRVGKGIVVGWNSVGYLVAKGQVED